MHQLYYRTDLKQIIFEDKNFEILSLALSDDANFQTFDGEWKGKLLSDSPLFTSLETIWGNLIPTYTEELSNLVWTDSLPPPTEILEVMKMIRVFMYRFDQQMKHL